LIFVGFWVGAENQNPEITGTWRHTPSTAFSLPVLSGHPAEGKR
jgi:hypothetical protein